MCGIVGFFGFDQKPAERSLLERMNAQIIHRGPDSDGFYTREHVGLAMRRLKIIDLATGDQPIFNEDRSLCIVFNGEIYNYRELRSELEKKHHRFTTRSDTEVILKTYQEYGTKCVQLLVGMFAFAIHDVKNNAVFIARDRLGVKPLFFHDSSRGVLFASEIKSLLQAPWVEKKIDLQAISHFLSLNYLPPPWTPWEGIGQLEPGHSMMVTPGDVKIHPYWNIPSGETISMDESDAEKQILQLLHRSMQRRLIADVPIGTYLSGGLDSSALVWLMKEHKHDTIKTFSAGFDHPSYDETPYAREIARHFGTDHHEVHCTAKDVIDLLPKIAWHADNLLADQAALPLYKVSQLAKQHVTVCLSGDGGDEVFIGYPTFHADRYHQIYSRIPSFVRRGIIQPAVSLLPASSAKLSFEYKAKKFIEAGDFSSEKAHYWWRTIHTDDEKRSLLSQNALRQIRNLDAYPLYEAHFDGRGQNHFVNRCLYADMKVWLAGNNLYKVDTMSMAHGLEARVPFLDHELVEFMARLSPELKFKNHTLKYLMKKVLAGKLPERILQRKKAGFQSPIAVWFRNDLKDYLKQNLLQDHFLLDEIFRKEALTGLVQEHIHGKHNHAFRLWGLLILRHWADHFLQ